jgi:hypothetical protein
MTSTRRFGRPVLPMSARQADCAHLPGVGLFRYFTFADRDCSGDDWSGTFVTGVSRQVKILFSHGFTLSLEHLSNPKPFMVRASDQFRSFFPSARKNVHAITVPTAW